MPGAGGLSAFEGLAGPVFGRNGWIECAVFIAFSASLLMHIRRKRRGGDFYGSRRYQEDWEREWERERPDRAIARVLMSVMGMGFMLIAATLLLHGPISALHDGNWNRAWLQWMILGLFGANAWVSRPPALHSNDAES